LAYLDHSKFDFEPSNDTTYEPLNYKTPYVEDDDQDAIHSNENAWHSTSSSSDTLNYHRDSFGEQNHFQDDFICRVCQGTDKTCDCLLRDARSRILRNYQLPADIKNIKNEYLNQNHRRPSPNDGPLLLEYQYCPREDLSPCGWKGLLPAGWSVRFEIDRRSPYSQRYPKPIFQDEFYHKTEERYKRRRKFGSPPIPERYPDDPLPPGWSRCESNTGRIFYWHQDSGLECYRHPAHNGRVFFENEKTYVPRDPSRFVDAENASFWALREARGIGLRWHAGLVEWHDATWIPLIKGLNSYGPEKWVLDDPNVPCQVSSWAMQWKPSNAAPPPSKNP